MPFWTPINGGNALMNTPPSSPMSIDFVLNSAPAPASFNAPPAPLANNPGPVGPYDDEDLRLPPLGPDAYASSVSSNSEDDEFGGVAAPAARKKRKHDPVTQPINFEVVRQLDRKVYPHDSGMDPARFLVLDQVDYIQHDSAFMPPGKGKGKYVKVIYCILQRFGPLKLEQIRALAISWGTYFAEKDPKVVDANIRTVMSRNDLFLSCHGGIHCLAPRVN